MSDYIQQITQLQEKVDNSKLEQARLQERQRTLQEEHKKILQELKVYEIEEQNLDKEINQLQIFIEEEIKKCINLLS